jgi:hypothetical protein
VLIAKFHKRSSFELSLGRHNQRSRLELVKVGHDKHEIGSFLDGKESASGNVDTDRIVKVLIMMCQNTKLISDVP